MPWIHDGGARRIYERAKNTRVCVNITLEVLCREYSNTYHLRTRQPQERRHLDGLKSKKMTIQEPKRLDFGLLNEDEMKRADLMRSRLEWGLG